MTPTITAFATSPDRGIGLARDMRVRWALEEVGQPYDVRLVSFAEMKQPAHLALFETGAIVFHIAGHHPGLLPSDANARARAITWMFAALATVEPPIVERAGAKLLEADKPWAAERMVMLEDRIRQRLRELSAYFSDSEWLDGAFSAADIMMVHVLQRLPGSGLVEEHGNLAAYMARATARPAYQRAFSAQLVRGNAEAGLNRLGQRPQTTKGQTCVWPFDRFFLGRKIGAGEGIRTLDPNLGKVMLYP